MEKDLQYWTKKYSQSKTAEEANKANFEMTKILMEKERTRMDSRTFKKLEYIVSGSGLLSSEVNEIVDLMEEYADLARKEEREKTIKECKEALIKQLLPVIYENGYPITAVPHATILMLDKLVSPSEKGEGRKGGE